MSQYLPPLANARVRNLAHFGLIAAFLTACGGGSNEDAQAPQAAASIKSQVTTGTAPAAAAAVDAPSDQQAPAVQAAGSYTEQLTQLYKNLLRRMPDAGGLTYWEGQMKQGTSLAEVERRFKISPEYIKLNHWSQFRTGETSTNLHVDASVEAEGNGSIERPFKSMIRAAAAVKQAGTTVWVRPGTYVGGIVTKTDGRNNAPIYWISTEKWGAKIVPPKVGENNHNYDKVAWFNQGPHVHIMGFDVNGSGTGKPWKDGIYSDGAYSVIRENHVSFIANRSDCGSGAGASGINLDSYQKDPGRRGKEMSAIANWVHDIGVPDTYCNKQIGIYISATGNVVNNIVHRSSGVGIVLWHDAHHVNIINNTVTGSMHGIGVGGGNFRHRRDGADGVVVVNNLLHDNYHGIGELDVAGKDNVYRNNLVSSSKFPWKLINGNKHYNSLSANPMFVSYARSVHYPNLNLLPGSPAIGAADKAYSPKVDFDGKPRNAGTGFDIGAVQH